MKMGNNLIKHSEKEKYSGNVIHEKGCAATINEDMRKLISKCDDIMKLAEHPIIGFLGTPLQHLGCMKLP